MKKYNMRTKLSIKTSLGIAMLASITFFACEDKEAQAAKAAKAEIARIEAAETEVARKGTFTDSRNKKSYKTVKIGKQTWMAENLNYAAKGSKCGGDDKNIKNENTSFCDKYGRLYNWEIAIKACPAGWHLPTNAEWNELTVTVGGKRSICPGDYECASGAGKYLKAKNGWDNKRDGSSGNGVDMFGFAALPGGWGSSKGIYFNVGGAGNWWSADELDAKDPEVTKAYKIAGAGLAYSYEIDDGYDDVFGPKSSLKNAPHSIRCIKN
jgi:uncharacterized protein (TIGR02145 family)